MIKLHEYISKDNHLKENRREITVNINAIKQKIEKHLENNLSYPTSEYQQLFIEKDKLLECNRKILEPFKFAEMAIKHNYIEINEKILLLKKNLDLFVASFNSELEKLIEEF